MGKNMNGDSPSNCQRILRVLIVEDNLMNQDVLGVQLGQLGCEVECAINGHDGIEAAMRTRYDLILMDCQMPIMDGYQAAREIRKRESGQRHTPIIAFTANDDESARAPCLEAGMDDILTKPVFKDRLKALLARWASGVERPAA